MPTGCAWVQGTAAGMGQLVRAAGLSAADLDRVTFTSSSGVHATQLAEWAMLGLLAFTKDLVRLQRDKAARRWDPDRRPASWPANGCSLSGWATSGGGRAGLRGASECT